MNAPAHAVAASEAQLFAGWRRQGSTLDPTDQASILAKLENELDVYFAKQAELAAAGLSALDR